MRDIEAFLAARDFLLRHRTDYETAYREFRWPRLETFNWALDHFDRLAEGNDATALWIVDAPGGESRASFSELARRSNRVANYLRASGVARGDRVLLMLDNVAPLWETMLALIKLGAVLIPSTPLLAHDDIADRLERGRVKHIVAGADKTDHFGELGRDCTRIAVGGTPADGWLDYTDVDEASDAFEPDGETRADDLLLLYFTSGTTARPKLVEHTHVSYPVGHLSTMYWIGLEPGAIHLNISSPGWAKHAWSNVFAPWNAGATVFVYHEPRFNAQASLRTIERYGVTSLCAPPTVWRMFIHEDLARYRMQLTELVGAGEPLNPEVIERVQQAWGLTIRDGYGQTETTCQIGNPPGLPVKAGAMGRPMPGYEISLLDPDDRPATEGEIALPLDARRPLGLMRGYTDGGQSERGGHYVTGDVARRDDDGYVTYVGRADDLFKASDYRISPFELESVLIEHDAVAEAAVVPSPDPVRLAVPKAFVALAAGTQPDRATALAILAHARQRLAPFKRIRRVEFVELPKTISGKIRRVDLRRREQQRDLDVRNPGEFWESDLPELK